MPAVMGFGNLDACGVNSSEQNQFVVVVNDVMVFFIVHHDVVVEQYGAEAHLSGVLVNVLRVCGVGIVMASDFGYESLKRHGFDGRQFGNYSPSGPCYLQGVFLQFPWSVCADHGQRPRRGERWLAFAE